MTDQLLRVYTPEEVAANIAESGPEGCEQTSRRWGLLDAEELVGRLNQKLDGWANYFRLGQVSKAYRAVDAHARRRLRHWLCRKHQVGGRGTSRFPDTYLHQILGLTRLEGRKRSFV